MFNILNIKRHATWHIPIHSARGRVINTPASYSWRPGFKLGPEIGYSDRGLRWFSSNPPVKYRDSILN
jgi:hypothetical protein